MAAGKRPGSPRGSSGGGSGALRLANVGEMPEDKVLEAWVQREGEFARSGLFVPDRAGQATTTIPDMGGVEAVMVTAEPRAAASRRTRFFLW